MTEGEGRRLYLLIRGTIMTVDGEFRRGSLSDV
jgi:hypothetical protein